MDNPHWIRLKRIYGTIKEVIFLKYYDIYFIHPEHGEMLVAIVSGKTEALKELNKLNKENRKIKFNLRESK